MAQQASITLSNAKGIHIGYICSKCNNPIISTIAVYAKATVYYQFSQKRAKAEAEELLENEFGSQSYRVESAWTKKDNLTITPERSWRDNSSSSLMYVDYTCPFCGNKEEWQGAPHDDACKKENYPRIFEALEEAEQWAAEYVLNKAKRIQEYAQSNPNAVKEANTIIRDLQEKEDTLRAEINAIPEKAELKEIEAKIKQVSEEINNAGAFELKKKSALKKENKANFELKNKLQTNIHEKEQPLIDELNKQKVQMYDNNAIVYGCLENPCEICGQDKKNKFARCYVVGIDYNDKNDYEEEATDTIIINKCPHCGAELLPDSEFCSTCGKPVSLKKEDSNKCPHCGAELLPDSSFCSSCGKPIT